MMTCDDCRPFRTAPTRRVGLVPILCLLVVASTGCRADAARTGASGESAVNDLESQIRSLLPDDPALSVAVSVIDPATGVRLHIEGDRLFHAASTMKIPVMIEVFRQNEAGGPALDDEVVLRNEFRSIVDGSPYSIEDDSDDSIYERLGTSMTIEELTDNMITVSSNLATNLLIDILDADSVQATSERLGTHRMVTLRGVEDIKAYERGLSNRATSADLAALLEAIMTGRAVSPEASARMIDILLRQEFNDMIPQGLPRDVRVAHKTGWITEIYHDAAIVLPPDAEPYVLVILTGGWEDVSEAARLGARITDVVHRSIRPDGGG